MVANITKTNTTKTKRLSKGARKHIRRMKQEARKISPLINPKKSQINGN